MKKDAFSRVNAVNRKDKNTLKSAFDIARSYRNHILKPVLNPIVLESGKGVVVFDKDGNGYLDLTTGGGVFLLGYHNALTDEVRRAALRQMEKISHIPHYIYYSEQAARLAEKLAAVAPGPLNRMFFCNSGSEAVEGAVRVVRKHKQRFEILALQQGFAGRTMGAASLTGLSSAKKGIGPLLPGVHHLPAPACRHCSIGHTYPSCELACARYCEDYLQFATCGDVAAVIAEPVLGDAGVIVPPPEYLAQLDAVCRRHDIAFVADETLSGLGRTGKMFAIEHSGVTPDVLTLGKALGGGFPLGAFIVSDAVAPVFEYEDFSSTAGGNPVACAAGAATIDIIRREGLVEQAAATGAYFKQCLEQLAGRWPAIADVRGQGLFMGVEIGALTAEMPAPAAAAAVKAALVCAGFLVDIFGGATLRLTPPLIFEKKHVERFTQGLHDVLSALDDSVK